MPFKPKPCRICGMPGHTAMTCFARKRNPNLSRRRMKTLGKVGKKWIRTRAEWFKQNPAEYYICYICGDRLTPRETTLDHIKSRSRHPELRFELSNLAPCCYRCNQEKGSRELEEVVGNDRADLLEMSLAEKEVEEEI